jgi:monoterpene epsilon-lactone hydrolase
MINFPTIKETIMDYAVKEMRRPLSAADREAVKALLKVEKPIAAKLAKNPNAREIFDEALSQTPIAEGVELEDIDQAGVRGWWIRPLRASLDRAILYVHGGGYALGNTTVYRGLVSQLVQRAGVTAFVLDYPLAPEHHFPAAYDAVTVARRWLTAQGVNQIVLAGDSAGGGLVLATLDEPMIGSATIAAVVAFSPWTDLALTGESFEKIKDDPILSTDAIRLWAAQYLAGADPKDGRASPLYRIPKELPPIYIQVGEREILLDDSRRYAALAAARGGQVRLNFWEGLFHLFQIDVASIGNARLALDDAAQFLNLHWR